MLTVKQLIMIETRNPSPPWKASALSALFPQRPMSLRSIVTEVSAQQVYLTFQIRDANILQIAGGSPTQLKALWPNAIPSKATLVGLAQLVSQSGMALKYISKDWQTVIVFGQKGAVPALQVLAASLPEPLMTPAQRGTVPASKILDDPLPPPSTAFQELTGAVIGQGAIFGALGSSTVLGVPFLGGAVGSFGVGLLAGDGLFRLFGGEPDVQAFDEGISIGFDSATDTVAATLFGGLPEGVTTADILVMPTVDMTKVPDEPVSPPGTCPVVCPTGPED